MMVQMILAAASETRGSGSGVITEATWTNLGFTYYGFDLTHGSTTNATLNDGKTIQAIVSYGTPTPARAYVNISGFSYDPGSRYLQSITVATTTLQGTAASYSFSSSTGVASWNWTTLAFPLDGVGTTSWSVND